MRIYAANGKGKSWLVLAASEAEARSLLPTEAEATAQVIEVLDRATGEPGVIATLSGAFTNDVKELSQRPTDVPAHAA